MSQKWLKKLREHHPTLAARADELNRLDQFTWPESSSKSKKKSKSDSESKKRDRDGDDGRISDATKLPRRM